MKKKFNKLFIATCVWCKHSQVEKKNIQRAKSFLVLKKLVYMGRMLIAFIFTRLWPVSCTTRKQSFVGTVCLSSSIRILIASASLWRRTCCRRWSSRMLSGRWGIVSWHIFPSTPPTENESRGTENLNIHVLQKKTHLPTYKEAKEIHDASNNTNNVMNLKVIVFFDMMLYRHPYFILLQQFCDRIDIRRHDTIAFPRSTDKIYHVFIHTSQCIYMPCNYQTRKEARKNRCRSTKKSENVPHHWAHHAVRFLQRNGRLQRSKKLNRLAGS